ncbi:MAG: hypothetical protein Q7L07_02570 [Pseudohongiella sp.]|nr:hypothetical protein [Pseudohongiella sp.]
MVVIRKLNIRLVIIFFVFLLSAILASISTNFLFVSEHIRSLAAYLNPLLAFFAILSASKKETYRLQKLIQPLFIFLLTLGVFQVSGLLASFESIFSFLIPRGASDSLSNIGRGVTLLATEPSRAGYELLFVYAGWRHFSEKTVRSLMLLDGLFFLYILTVIQSAMAAYLSIFYFSVLYVRHYKVSLVLILFFVALVSFTETRASNLIKDLFTFGSFGEIYDYIIDASGFRLISIISAYSYGITSLFGGGVGLWQTSSIVAMESAGFSAVDINFFIFHANSEFTSIRPTSYAANIALDLGVVGLAIVLILMSKYITTALRQRRRDNNAIIWLFIFSFFLIGAVGNPVPWVLLALIVRQAQNVVKIEDNFKLGDSLKFVENKRVEYS